MIENIPQNTETYFSVLIEVWIESNRFVARRHQFDSGRADIHYIIKCNQI